MYDTNDIAESLDSTWIVSGQSPVQRDMIRFLPKTKALYVEGAFRVWLREAQVTSLMMSYGQVTSLIMHYVRLLL